MILVDFNQIIISDASIFQKKVDSNISISDIRNLFFYTLLKIAKKFKPTYGDIVICCDARCSWRAEQFPYYKENRKKDRSETPVDWETIFKAVDAIKQEMKEHFHYRVVDVDRAEGDDIIAVIARHTYEKKRVLEKGQLYESEPEPVLIVSEDKDFKQLQIMSNVDQYSLRNDKMIRENRPDLFLLEQIIRGDRLDGVPNFLSDGDSLVMKKRQKPIRQNDLDIWLEYDCVEEFPESEKITAETKENWYRNKKMIDLLHDEIPQDLRKNIIDAFENAHVADKSKVFNYFIKFKVKSAIDGVDQL